MKPIFIDKSNKISVPMYVQLYRALKDDILSGNLRAGDKLPSLRRISEQCGISITTSGQAYDQLLVEGYVFSKPKSGFYVSDIKILADKNKVDGEVVFNIDEYLISESPYIYDSSTFDFQKWKKCTNRIFNDYSSHLLFESDIQGERILRYEISKYLYSSRGVTCTPDQIVLGAGTQQLTGYLCRILKKMGIEHVCTEDPGYAPIQNIFRDHGFGIGKIPVTPGGIEISMLPINIRSAVYVSPSNQFPTGAVMPIGKRYELIEWAKKNDSTIIEDDYDSELRYFGNPIPALQGLDSEAPVCYMGSFSSTLFPAIKISYMILPDRHAEIFKSIKDDYRQTCSKTEQLTLALFMEDGFYYTNIRKLRSLYSQKLDLVISSLKKYAKGFISPINTKSGLNLPLLVKTDHSVSKLSELAKASGIRTVPIDIKKSEGSVAIALYYNQIPIDKIEETVKILVSNWSS